MHTHLNDHKILLRVFLNSLQFICFHKECRYIGLICMYILLVVYVLYIVTAICLSFLSFHVLIRRSALETNYSKDDSNLSHIHGMSLYYGSHFPRIWVNFKLNPLEINFINTGIHIIINYHLYYIYNMSLYLNMHIFILIVSITDVWYVLLLMLFCR